MRAIANDEKVRRFIQELGRRSTGPGRVYLTGGATAVMVGWRSTTVDVDVKLDPEPPGAFDAIARLKDELDVNVELASPDQFIPAVPGWEDRSLSITTLGAVQFLHYDPVGQCLAKIERGHTRDLSDVRAMVERGLASLPSIRQGFEQIRPLLTRYPAIDEATFAVKVAHFVESFEER